MECSGSIWNHGWLKCSMLRPKVLPSFNFPFIKNKITEIRFLPKTKRFLLSNTAFFLQKGIIYRHDKSWNNSGCRAIPPWVHITAWPQCDIHNSLPGIIPRRVLSAAPGVGVPKAEIPAHPFVLDWENPGLPNDDPSTHNLICSPDRVGMQRERFIWIWKEGIIRC